MNAIRRYQTDNATRHINLSQTAAFLASVTATTLQYTALAGPPVSVANATTVVWYLSLGLAVSSALLSLLAAVLTQYPKYVTEFLPP